MVHIGAPSPELDERVQLHRTGQRAGDDIIVHNADTSRLGPRAAALEVPLAEDGTLRVLVEGVAGPISTREFDRSLVFFRVPWGRTTFSDLLIDRSNGELIYHDRVVDGADAWRQRNPRSRLGPGVGR
jgi:hypothetical protein